MTQKMNRAGGTSSVADEIDKNIKRAFDDVANQELPTRFTDLLDQLRAQSSTGSESNHDN